MKIKRIILITWAIMGVALLCYTACRLGYLSHLGRPWELINFRQFYLMIDSIINSIAIILCFICGLAVVDFIFCLGENKYNKSMLGIAITMFVLSVIFVVSSMILGVTIISMGLAGLNFYSTLSLYLWTIFTAAPFVGLAIAYVAVKRKFILSTSQRKKSTQQNEE